jgi:uncharacterized protein YpmS
VKHTDLDSEGNFVKTNIFLYLAKENLNIWKFIAVVLNILWSLFLIKLTLTRILHMEMKIYSEEAKKGQRVFKVNEFKHSDILK